VKQRRLLLWRDQRLLTDSLLLAEAKRRLLLRGLLPKWPS
jgi:hypothetical protein